MTKNNNNLEERLQKTEALYSKLTSARLTPKVTPREIIGFFKDGAIPDITLLDAYLQNVAKMKNPFGTSLKEAVEMMQTVSCLVECGVKINDPLNSQGQTILQKVIDAGAENNPYFANLAITLLKNSAGFNLDKAQQEKLVKGILKYNPKYIETVLKKGWIDSSFKIGDQTLYGYATKTAKVKPDVAKFISEAPLLPDNIERKKTKILAKELLPKFKTASEIAVARANEQIIHGVNTKKGVEYVEMEGADGRNRKFMVKNDHQPNIITTQFAGDLFNILSSKTFVAKSGFLVQSSKLPQGLSYATKWDSAAEGDAIINGVLQDQSEEALLSYSRMGGVTAVLGEDDHNTDGNTLQSGKHKRMVKIDITALRNVNLGAADSRVYGSLQSLEVLQKISGMLEKEIDDSSMAIINERSRLANDFKEYPLGAKMRKLYNQNINDDLLEKIKANISQNTSESKLARKSFMQFMRGVQEAIDLSQDEKFLDAYVAKYKDLPGNSHQFAQECQQLFAENAKQAQQQYGKYLEYYQQISREENAEKAKKMNWLKPAELRVMTQDSKASKEPLPETQATAKESIKVPKISEKLPAAIVKEIDENDVAAFFGSTSVNTSKPSSLSSSRDSSRPNSAMSDDSAVSVPPSPKPVLSKEDGALAFKRGIEKKRSQTAKGPATSPTKFTAKALEGLERPATVSAKPTAIQLSSIGKSKDLAGGISVI